MSDRGRGSEEGGRGWWGSMEGCGVSEGVLEINGGMEID